MTLSNLMMASANSHADADPLYYPAVGRTHTHSLSHTQNEEYKTRVPACKTWEPLVLWLSLTDDVILKKCRNKPWEPPVLRSSLTDDVVILKKCQNKPWEPPVLRWNLADDEVI